MVGPCPSSRAECLENFFSCHLDCTGILSCHQWMATLFCFVLSPSDQIVHSIYTHQISKTKIFSINNQQGLSVISRGTLTIVTIYNLLPPTSGQYMEGSGVVLKFWYQIQHCHFRRMIWKSVSYGDPPYQTQPVYHHMMCSYLSCQSILTIVTSYRALKNFAYVVVNLHVFISNFSYSYSTWWKPC